MRSCFPFNTFHDLHPEITDLMINAKYDDAKNKDLVEEEIRELLRIRRHVKTQADDNFDIFGPDSLTELWGQITGGLVAFMIAVSSVGLMVGGVGVMNIMLVSVTERTREIGIRKAIGATKRTILTQFTVEAVTLCALGGVIGILFGAVITWIVYFLPIGLPATLSTMWVMIGFSSHVRLGCCSGSIRRGKLRIWIRLRRCGTSNSAESGQCAVDSQKPTIDCRSLITIQLATVNWLL